MENLRGLWENALVRLKISMPNYVTSAMNQKVCHWCIKCKCCVGGGDRTYKPTFITGLNLIVEKVVTLQMLNHSDVVPC